MTGRHDRGRWWRRLWDALRVVPWWVLALAGLGLVLTVVLVVLGILNRRQADDATQGQQQAQVELGRTADRARSLAGEILAECTTGELTGPVCDRADDVARDPVPPPAPASATDGLTVGEVEAIVAAYLTEHPPPAGRGPTPEEVAAAVAAYLTENPPDPGRPPTPDEVAGAVALWFAANPTPAGEPGRPPTAEEIDAAVARWFADHPPPPDRTCPTGFEPVETGGATAVDGTHYARSITCVDPDSALPPPTTDPPATSDPPPTTEPPTTTGPPAPTG